MPTAAIGAAVGGLGSLGSSMGGKKAQKAANKLAQQQLGLQQEQFGLAKQQTGLGNQALSGSTNYWNALMKGGQAARQATGPYASLIGQAQQGARNNILATTARGGEQNLALAQNAQSTADQISRLYNGMQPMAAQGLAANAGQYFGSGSGFNPGANIGGAYGQYALAQQQAAQAGQGFGSILFNAINKMGNKNPGTITVGQGPVPLFG